MSTEYWDGVLDERARILKIIEKTRFMLGESSADWTKELVKEIEKVVY